MAKMKNLTTGKQLMLVPRHAFGRDNKAVTTLLNDPCISRDHAVIFWDENQWYVRDLSLNGTFLNGLRMSKGQSQPLIIGDNIVFGSEVGQAWQFVDGSRPKSMLMAVSHHASEIVLDDFQYLPSEENPDILLYHRGDTWICETETGSYALKDGDVVTAQGKKWQLIEAKVATNTLDFADINVVPKKALSFRFEVDKGSEQILLKMRVDETEFEIEEQGHHYPMYELARLRMTDQESGIDTKEQGWTDKSAFVEQLGFRNSGLLDKQIHRFNRQVKKVAKDNGELEMFWLESVDSRQDQIRFFTDNVEIIGAQ